MFNARYAILKFMRDTEDRNSPGEQCLINFQEGCSCSYNYAELCEDMSVKCSFGTHFDADVNREGMTCK